MLHTETLTRTAKLFAALVASISMLLLAASPSLAQEGGQQDEETLFFEVTTEGDPAPDATFFGMYIKDPAGDPNGEIPPPSPAVGWNSLQLTDPDGDGMYVDRRDLEQGRYLVAIFKGTGTLDEAPVGPNNEIEGNYPGKPYELISQQSIIKKDATITLDGPKTVSASYDFSDDMEDTLRQCFLPEGCFLSGDDASESIYGGIGPDRIIGGYGDDDVFGAEAGDWLDGGADDDRVRGGTGDDLVDGGTGDDAVSGDGGNDTVYGYDGSDALYGNLGNDFVYSAGDGAFDRVSGGDGYDVCVVDSGDDVSGCEEVYTG